MSDPRDYVSRFPEDAADWVKHHAEPVEPPDGYTDGDDDEDYDPEEEEPFCCRRRDCGCGGYNR
jgi:hypothetical protein